MSNHQVTPLQIELSAAINRVSAENGSNTPDFVLARYLEACLNAFNTAVRQREAWKAPMPTTAPGPGTGHAAMQPEPQPQQPVDSVPLAPQLDALKRLMVQALITSLEETATQLVKADAENFIPAARNLRDAAHSLHKLL